MIIYIIYYIWGNLGCGGLSILLRVTRGGCGRWKGMFIISKFILYNLFLFLFVIEFFYFFGYFRKE